MSVSTDSSGVARSDPDLLRIGTVRRAVRAIDLIGVRGEGGASPSCSVGLTCLGAPIGGSSEGHLLIEAKLIERSG